MSAIGRREDQAWLVLSQGEWRVGYLDREDDGEDGPLIWWDQNHDTEICEEGEEEAATQINLPAVQMRISL